MLKQRLICKLLIDRDGTAVKYKRFTESRRIVGDPVSLMKTMEDMVLDEFNITFLGAVDRGVFQRMVAHAFCPVAVAGSIRDMDTVNWLFHDGGADKVVIKDDALGWKVAEKYGAQAAVYPVDYTGRVPTDPAPEWAGELLLTSIARDGLGVGFDLEALKQVYKIPVVLAGGCGKLHHAKEALAAGASGVAVSSMFAFTDKSPIKLRSWLISEGANVRVA